MIFQNSVLFPTNYAGFRRSFADKLFKNEFAIDRMQEIMRHRTINTTSEHYKTFNKENVIKEMNEKLKK